MLLIKGPENYIKPFAWEKKSSTGGFHKEEINGSGGEGGDVTEVSPPSARPPEPEAKASKEQQPPSSEAREGDECLKGKRKATSKEKDVGGSVGFSSSSSSTTTLKDSGAVRSAVDGGLASLIEQSQQEMKINVNGPDTEVGNESGEGSKKECIASVDLGGEGPRGSSPLQGVVGMSDNDCNGVEAGHSLHADVDVESAAAACLPVTSGMAVEAATVLGGSREGRDGDEDGRQRKMIVEAGDGIAASVSANQPSKSLGGGIFRKQRAVGTRSVRGRGCAEGASGSSWKSDVSVQVCYALSIVRYSSL